VLVVYWPPLNRRATYGSWELVAVMAESQDSRKDILVCYYIKIC
jgi:hypothetical protein